MSPRQNRRRRDGEAPGAGSGRAGESVEEWPDGDWQVRRVVGSDPGRTYRCPGCDQEIRGDLGHLVAWPVGAFGGPDDRRHWHTPCWRARSRRGANVQRTRGAPRYG
jgi:hypothetical protein